MKEKLCYVGYDIHAELKLAQGKTKTCNLVTKATLKLGWIIFERYAIWFPNFLIMVMT